MVDAAPFGRSPRMIKRFSFFPAETEKLHVREVERHLGYRWFAASTCIHGGVWCVLAGIRRNIIFFGKQRILTRGCRNGLHTFDLSSASLAFCPSCFPLPLPSCHTVPLFSRFSFLPPGGCCGDNCCFGAAGYTKGNNGKAQKLYKTATSRTILAAGALDTHRHKRHRPKLTHNTIFRPVEINPSRTDARALVKHEPAFTCHCPPAPRPGLLLRLPLAPALALSCALAATRSSTSGSAAVQCDWSSDVVAVSLSAALDASTRPAPSLLAVLVTEGCRCGGGCHIARVRRGPRKHHGPKHAIC